MTTSTICLPTHILDAHITPRAREVLMLLASQTTSESPSLSICQSETAARLRCSTATVARAIKQLIEAKLIADTGHLHEGRYKIYHVRWSSDENLKAVSKKFKKPVRKVAAAMPFEGTQLVLPPVAEVETAPPPKAPISTLTPQTLIKGSRIAHFAEIARQQHAENLRLHQAILRELR